MYCKILSLNLRAPFCKSTFTTQNLVACLDLNTREKYYVSFMYTMYAYASNNTPSYTHVSSYVV